GAPFEADSWTKPDLGSTSTGVPNNQARVGNWVNQVGTDPYGNLGAPYGANNGTGTQIPGRTAWLGGLNPRTCIIGQEIDTAGQVGKPTTLTYKLVYEDEDVAGADFLYVDFGGQRIQTVDLGAYWTNYGPFHREGGVHFWVRENPVIDLTPYMDGTVKTLSFTVVNDAKANTSSSAWIDNVSIQAVPEPATMAGLAFGALALLRRRRRV
ncbi:PEP-CTERM sorting domain-containing protein, partial [bacterium]